MIYSVKEETHMDIDIKIPNSKEEMDALKATLRQEISDAELDNVVGGNDDLKGKGKVPWDCPFCGAHLVIKAAQDAAKHMTKCPNNPYK